MRAKVNTLTRTHIEDTSEHTYNDTYTAVESESKAQTRKVKATRRRAK